MKSAKIILPVHLGASANETPVPYIRLDNYLRMLRH